MHEQGTDALPLTIRFDGQRPQAESGHSPKITPGRHHVAHHRIVVAVVASAKEAIDLAVAGMGSSILATTDITQHYLRDFSALIDHLTLDQDAMHTRVGQILLGRATGPEAALIFI